MNKRIREQEAIKLVRWISENPSEADLVINDHDYHNPKEYIKILRTLEKSKLEYLIPLALYSARNKWVFNKAYERMQGEYMAQHWNEKDTKRIRLELKAFYKEEMQAEKESNKRC